MNITKLNPDVYESDGAAVHLDEYQVITSNGIQMFSGTYTQCLIYIGAVTMGKDTDIARKFAYGIYR